LPPPPKVNQPERIRESLKPGKTYQCQANGTVTFRGTDRAWGLESVITINHEFESKVDRKIESNDGTKIVEIRHFRSVRSIKIESQVEDLRINLGGKFDGLLDGLGFFDPMAAGVLRKLSKLDLKAVAETLPWLGGTPEQLLGLDEKAKGFASIDRLTGKSCRVTYVDGTGVVEIEDVVGRLDPKERDMIRASVLVSDSLIFPNEKVAVDKSWTVSGRALGDMIDPSLRATTSGEFTLQRQPDRDLDGRKCALLKITDGRILFDSSNAKEGNIGHFDPAGTFDYSLEDKVVIRGNAKGAARLEKFSKDHLLFETRSIQQPTLQLTYRCKIIDAP
jgi:hypothetical protein